MHHKGGRTNFQRWPKNILLLSPVVILIGLAVLNPDGLTKNWAETDPHHADSTLATRTFKIPYDPFFEITLDLLKSLPLWQVVRHDRQSGEIVAERQTRIFRFTDDIRIKITKTGPDALTLNLRSASRIGKGDFGQNARNIREFFAGIEKQVERFIADRLESSA